MLGKTNIRIAPNKKRPPDYVEYIDGTGTQYIDTEVTATGVKLIKFEVDMSVPSGYPQSMWGPSIYMKRRNSLSYSTFIDGVYNGYDTDVSAVPRFTGTLECNVINKTWTRTNINNSNAPTQNGTLPSDFADFSNLPIYIFACNSETGAIEIASSRLYSFKIYFDNVLVRDFKPCRDRHEVYCLYDEVSKTYFYNIGTGEFSGGVSINREVDYVEYIQSTGTQYIDTGIVPNTNTKVEIAFQATSVTSSESWIYAVAQGTAGSFRAGLVSKKFYTSNGFSYSQSVTTAYTVATGACAYNQTLPAYLFSQRENNSIAHTANSKYKLFYCKIWENNILIAHFRPCKDKAGNYCLYDEITKTYLYNNGTGEFSGGERVW
ncbi:MAG: hypothetical protein IJX99_08645 [Clostridia bacterium]|nr:hypothetical protein [Clostridia bacterium]